MRHSTMVAVVIAAVLASVLPPIPAEATRCSATREHLARAATRAERDADVVRSAFECDTARATRAFGSRDRCLRELCGRGDVTNAYVRGPNDRLRANPCVGLDPFDLR